MSLPWDSASSGEAVELEIVDTSVAPGDDEATNVPFLMPARYRGRAGGAGTALFFESTNTPERGDDYASLKKSRLDTERALEVDADGENSATTELSSMFEAEEDKSFLEVQLERLVSGHAAHSQSDGAVVDTQQGHDSTIGICAYLLKRYFGIATGEFRPRQQEVCLSILGGHSSLAVCPTGWGKSLCYQFPMLVHRLLFVARSRCWQDRADEPAVSEADSSTRIVESHRFSPQPESRFCVVVSPLLSLIADQMEKIEFTGCLRAVTLSSQTSAAAEEALLNRVASPVSDIDIVFTSPEKYIGSSSLRRFFAKHAHRLTMVCVDEVHCVSQWAYDFRPSFMYVSRVLSDIAPEVAPRIPFLCLTATATSTVVTDLKREFRIARTVCATDLFRRNLFLQSVDLPERQRQTHSHTRPHETPSTEAREVAVCRAPTTRVLQDALCAAVREMPKPMIVYVQSRADADELSAFLSARLSSGGSGDAQHHSSDGQKDSHRPVFASYSDAPGAPRGTAGPLSLTIRCYHAALARHLRTSTQQQFLKDKIDVLVATVAFGMGIDKSNLRSVIHAYAPSSVESYVQEIGRAGRDGQTSYCRILYNPYDYYDLRCRTLSSLLAPSDIEAVVKLVFESPVTRFGHDKFTLVSPYKVAEALSLPEETVETVLFMILCQQHTISGDGETPRRRQIFRRLHGTFPLGYKVVKVRGAEDAEKETAARSPAEQRYTLSDVGMTTGQHAVVSGAAAASRRAGRKSSRRVSSRSAGQGAGVSSLLSQLNARDTVLEVFRQHNRLDNQVVAANEAGLSWDDFQFRVDDLIQSGAIQVSRLSASAAYLLEVGSDYADTCSPLGQAEVSSALFNDFNTRLQGQVERLQTLFAVLACPSWEAIQDALQRSDQQSSPSKTGQQRLVWAPPPRSLTRVEAVSIANDFVAKNGLRIRSAYEAARCLLGVMPKSLIKHGKYAGQIPLALSWYVSCPYFGALKEFDVEWVLAILKPHALDSQDVR